MIGFQKLNFDKNVFIVKKPKFIVLNLKLVYKNMKD